MSVLRTGRGHAGGGGEVEFLTEKIFPLRNVPGVLKRKKNRFFSLLNVFFLNVPGVLKRMHGGGVGVFGAPHAPARGSRGVGKRYTSSYDHDM